VDNQQLCGSSYTVFYDEFDIEGAGKIKNK